jgi:multiple sugar transport system permease protein
MRYHKTALLFLTPFLTVFVAFYLAPVFYAIYLSLFIRKPIGVGPPKEVFGGIENYVRAVQDTDFLNGLKNIVLFGIVQIPVMLGLAIFSGNTSFLTSFLAQSWCLRPLWFCPCFLCFIGSGW